MSDKRELNDAKVQEIKDEIRGAIDEIFDKHSGEHGAEFEKALRDYAREEFDLVDLAGADSDRDLDDDPPESPENKNP